MRAILVFLQSPDVKLLGVTVVVGDGWRDEETAHALRLLELMGRTDIPVVPGARAPLWRTKEWTRMAARSYGKAGWMGAWRDNYPERTFAELPPLREGSPVTKPSGEGAAQFLVRMVREHPHQVTIFAAGPLTNIATAIRLDPEFPQLAEQLVLMGGSLNPVTEEPEWTNNPRHEFNFWFDPEAASITLRAPWKRIGITTIDASLQTRIDPEVLDGLAGADSPAARYLQKYITRPVQGIGQFAWDELAAVTMLDPDVVRHEKFLYIDVNTDHGAGYGDTLTWSEQMKPDLPLQKAHLYTDIDLPRLQRKLIELFRAPTPGAVDPAILQP